MDEVLAVDVLDPRDQLVCQQQHCLQAEPPATTKTVEVGFFGTNIFVNSDKYVLQFRQMCIAIDKISDRKKVTYDSNDGFDDSKEGFYDSNNDCK